MRTRASARGIVSRFRPPMLESNKVPHVPLSTRLWSSITSWMEQRRCGSCTCAHCSAPCGTPRQGGRPSGRVGCPARAPLCRPRCSVHRAAWQVPSPQRSKGSVHKRPFLHVQEERAYQVVRLLGPNQDVSGFNRPLVPIEPLQKLIYKLGTENECMLPRSQAREEPFL